MLDVVDVRAHLMGVIGGFVDSDRRDSLIDNYRSVATYIIIWAVINIKDKGGIKMMPPFLCFE